MFCSNGRIGCKYCRDAKSLGPLTHTGVALSKLWSNAEIGDGGNNKSSTRLNSLRNKIHKHVSSAAHLLPCKTRESKEQKGLEEELEAQTVKVEHITECVFFAQQNATGHSLITRRWVTYKLQQLNGIDLGVILHSLSLHSNKYC